LEHDPTADPEVVFFAFDLFVTRDYLIGFAVVCLIILLEFLWIKFRSKGKEQKKYPIFTVILFWIGAILGILPFILMNIHAIFFN